MHSIHIPLKLSNSNGLTISQERVMRDYQRKKSLVNFRMESARKEAKRIVTKSPLKPHRRISIIQLSPWSRMHRVECCGFGSTEKSKFSMKTRESVKLKENLCREPKARAFGKS